MGQNTSPAASNAANHSSEKGIAFGGGFNTSASCFLPFTDFSLPLQMTRLITNYKESTVCVNIVREVGRGNRESKYAQIRLIKLLTVIVTHPYLL